MLPADRRHACCLSGAEIENVANRGIYTPSTETFTSTSAVLGRAALLTTFPFYSSLKCIIPSQRVCHPLRFSS